MDELRDTQYNLPVGTDCISRQQAVEIRDANLMDYEEAEQIIADRIRWEEEGSEDD